MIKTIIFRLEGAILNDVLLHFKYYEKLWYYLRRDQAWKDFEKILRLREYLLSQSDVQDPYLIIANRYLSERENTRYQQEIKLFARKYLLTYLRMVPGMRTILKNMNYYYNTVLVASRQEMYAQAMQRYRLKSYFNVTLIDTQSYQNMIRHILQKTKSEVNQVTFVSERLAEDIARANNIGMYTIQARFDEKTKGITPQNINERKYFESYQKVSDFTRIPRRPNQIPHAVADKPEDILRIVQKLAEGEEPAKDYQMAKSETEINFWDIARQVLFPDLPKKNS